MTNKFALILAIVALSYPSHAQPVAEDKGRIHQGPFVFYIDDDGGAELQYRNIPIFLDAGMFCGYNEYTKYMDCEDKKVERTNGKAVSSFRLPGSQIRFVQTTSIEGGRIKIELVRRGAWPEGTAYWNFGMRFAFAYLLSHERATGRRHPLLAAMH